MNLSIIPRNYPKRKNFSYFQCIIILSVLILVFSVDFESPKYQEYEEASGTIHRVKIEKTDAKLRIITWLSAIILAMLILHRLEPPSRISTEIPWQGMWLICGYLNTSLALKKPPFEQNVEIFRKRYKISLTQQRELYQTLCETPTLTSKALSEKFPEIRITVNQINRIRKEWGLNRRCGRPAQKEMLETKAASQSVLTHLPKIGLKAFALWLESKNIHRQALETVGSLIKKYKENHPQENFRLLCSSQSIIAKKWKALNLLALAGIKKLSQLDYHQHDLDRVSANGESYSYSTLRQFLGELERIDVGSSLKTLLHRCVRGKWAYIDGHMIALWSKLKSHKGYITMLGRVMAGSKLVVTHDEMGKNVDFDYYPPDTHLLQIIEDYCSHVVAATGITDFVIDREINCVEIAHVFEKNRWGLICLLDANEYNGLSSFKKKYCKTMPDGTILYRARWAKYRDDPRRFVIVKEAERTLVYWYTKAIAKKGLTAEQIVSTYRRRAEVQENSFKRMIAHGALNTNFGYKRVWRDDRTHQRKIDKIDEKIEKKREKLRKKCSEIDRCMEKIRLSIERRHGVLLAKRSAKLGELHRQKNEINLKIVELESTKENLGNPLKKADRDFRKQSIMTFRTLSMENHLQDFISLLTNSTKEPMGIEMVLDLFFHRRGIMVENPENIVFWVESANLSGKYRSVLKEIIGQFNLISLTYRGKAIIAKIDN